MKWFDRQFDFSFGMERHRLLLERLQHAPVLIQKAVGGQPENALELQPGGKWSAKEHIAHLFVLEPMWRQRFGEIREGRHEMSAADLTNAATNEGRFNTVSLTELTDRFARERSLTMTLLNSLREDDHTRTSMHPRLQKPMRIIDLMYFVAEHDTHHLDAVRKML